MDDPSPPPVLTLSELRRRLGRSQAEVATAIGTTQSGVSRIEHQADMHVSTLNEYASALGGRLRLIVEHGDGSAEIGIPALRQERREQRREFRVVWQDQATRSLVHVGWLVHTGDEFTFSYVDEAQSHERFQPFPAFPRLDETYKSSELFPYFALRLTSAADPRYDAVLDALGLTREDATPVELLARSPDSPHDTIQVVPEPTEMADGTLVRVFLVSGIRHADKQDPDTVSRLIENLAENSPLDIEAEPNNPSNPQALRLTANGKRVGWVPDYLLAEIRGCIDANRSVSITVARANGPDAPPHMRLLCRLTVAPGRSIADQP